MNEGDYKLRHYWLYILKCDQDKYYIGVTSKTPEVRMQEHIKGIRSVKWTMKYKPIKLIDRKDLGTMTYKNAEKFENKVVRACIKQYGINNARGGDLRDTEDYIVRFGYIFDKSGWEVITAVAFLMLVIIVLTMAYYMKKLVKAVVDSSDPCMIYC